MMRAYLKQTEPTLVLHMWLSSVVESLHSMYEAGLILSITKTKYKYPTKKPNKPLHLEGLVNLRSAPTQIVEQWP